MAKYVPVKSLGVLILSLITGLANGQVKPETLTKLGQLADLVWTFKEKLDEVERGGKVATGAPAVFDEKKYEELRELSRQVERHKVESFQASIKVDARHVFSLDAKVRKEYEGTSHLRATATKRQDWWCSKSSISSH